MKFRMTALMSGLIMSNMVLAATEINLTKQSPDYFQKASHLLSNNKTQIKTIRSDIDFNGTKHTRIQQTYEGIRVWGAVGIIHVSKNRSISSDNASMDGIIYEGLDKDLLNSSFSADAVSKSIAVAKNAHAAKTRIVSSSFKEEKASPIIFIDENKIAHKAYLVSFTYSSSKAMHRPTSIIDAATQQVYRSWEGILSHRVQTATSIEDARAKVKKLLEDDNTEEMYDLTAGGVGGNPKAGDTIYDGLPGNKAALNIKAMDFQTSFGEEITLCTLKNDDIDVIDAGWGSEPIVTECYPSKKHNNLPWLSLYKGETRWLDDEVNEGYSPSIDAFAAASYVKNLYQDWMKVPALITPEGKPMKYLMRVHFGRHYENAFWDGKQMTFGDGDRMFYPLTSAGVTAHEISHGFTETHSNIDYSLPEMGALHESFSDMASAALENYLTGKNSWDLGRDIMKGDGALRYLDNPTKDGSSIDHMKDFDNTEAHAGAGVTNKAFYLLATTKGWNTKKAFEVMAKANMHYWNASMTNFTEAACGVLHATKDYGYNIGDVRVAFVKVGIETSDCAIK